MPVLLDKLDFTGPDIPLRFATGTNVVIPLTFTDNGDVLDISTFTWDMRIVDDAGTVIGTFAIVVEDGPKGLASAIMDSAGMAKGQYRWEAWQLLPVKTMLWYGAVEVLESLLP